MKPLAAAALLLGLALAGTEAVAYWWMHPVPAGQGQAVLTYQPGTARASAPPAPASADPATDADEEVALTLTPLPDIVARSIPSLRCTTGSAIRLDAADGTVIHLAFFEWDLGESAGALEAFRHLPEECMGSIGMKLVKNHPPRGYVVGGQGTVGLDRRAGPLVASGVGSQGNEEVGGLRSEVKDQEEALAQSSSSSPPHLQFPISNHSLLFDHTEFRDPAGIPIHAFKGTWVSGMSSLIGDGFRGGSGQWRQIRWLAALKRFHPAHSRVAQGTVHGIADPDRAWQVFQQAMLGDLSFQL